MASVEQMAQQLQECMQEIARLRLSLQQQQQQPQQVPPIVVHASPSAADIANEFTKVGKLDHFEGDEAKWSGISIFSAMLEDSVQLSSKP